MFFESEEEILSNLGFEDVSLEDVYEVLDDVFSPGSPNFGSYDNYGLFLPEYKLVTYSIRTPFNTNGYTFFLYIYDHQGKLLSSKEVYSFQCLTSLIVSTLRNLKIKTVKKNIKSE